MGQPKYTEAFLKGKKYEWLTFVAISHRDKHHNLHCKWKCDCGEEVIANLYSILYRRKKCCNKCKLSISGKNNSQWNGVGDIPATFWTKLKSGAQTRKIKVSVTFQYLWKLFLKQDRKCALTGEPLVFASKYASHDGTASIDRIDSTKGYSKDNVQWVHKDINWMKQSFPQDRFIELCEKVVAFKHGDLTTVRSVV